MLSNLPVGYSIDLHDPQTSWRDEKRLKQTKCTVKYNPADLERLSIRITHL